MLVMNYDYSVILSSCAFQGRSIQSQMPGIGELYEATDSDLIKVYNVVKNMRELAETYLSIEREISINNDTVSDELLATSAVMKHTLQSACDWVSKIKF